jgi:hypothetical protein
MDAEGAVSLIDLAAKLRGFCETLLRSRYVQHLESEVAALKVLMRERIREKDEVIAGLREENAALKQECDRMRLVLMPMSSPAGAAYAAAHLPRPGMPPKFAQEPSSWQAYVSQHIAEEEKKAKEELQNGVQGKGRDTVHQSPADGAARTQA